MKCLTMLLAMFVSGLFSVLLHASEPLTREGLMSSMETIMEITKAVDADPNLSALADKLDQEQGDQIVPDVDSIVSDIKTLGLYDKANKAAKSNGLESIEQAWEDFSRGVLASVSLQMEASGMTPDDMKQQISQMKAMGLPPEATQGIESMLVEVTEIAAKVSSEDKQFMKDNMGWFMQAMQQMGLSQADEA